MYGHLLSVLDVRLILLQGTNSRDVGSEGHASHCCQSEPYHRFTISLIFNVAIFRTYKILKNQLVEGASVVCFRGAQNTHAGAPSLRAVIFGEGLLSSIGKANSTQTFSFFLFFRR